MRTRGAGECTDKSPPPQLTGNPGDEAEGPQDTEGAQSFDVEAAWFAAHVVSLTGFVGHLLQDDAEKPEGDNEGGGREGRPHFFVCIQPPSPPPRSGSHPTMTMTKSRRFQPLRM